MAFLSIRFSVIQYPRQLQVSSEYQSLVVGKNCDNIRISAGAGACQKFHTDDQNTYLRVGNTRSLDERCTYEEKETRR